MYQQKPVDAFQMTAERRRDTINWPQWLQDAWGEPAVNAVFPVGVGTYLGVGTLEGIIAVEPGDWIVRCSGGYLVVYTDADFTAEFTPVAPADAPPESRKPHPG